MKLDPFIESLELVYLFGSTNIVGGCVELMEKIGRISRNPLHVLEW